MVINENVSLKNYSTMRIGGLSKYLTVVGSVSELIEAVDFADKKNLDIIVIGQGSNVIWKDEGFEGLVIVNRIKSFKITSTTKNNTFLTIGGGEIWDEVVQKTVDLNLSGLEFLSLIPGTAGATPIQNVGAYGQDISKLLVSLEAYDLSTKQIVTINQSDCDFNYRTSRFNSVDKNRFIILKITLKLSKSSPKPPFYESLNKYLINNKIIDFTPRNIRQAVIAIRNSKLPDPQQIANCGSFFANPIIDQKLLQSLLATYPQLVHWPENNNQFKISAAWLIEQAGFKNYYDENSGFGTYDKQPLVIVNYHGQSAKDLAYFVNLVKDRVKSKFGIDLKQEPSWLP